MIFFSFNNILEICIIIFVGFTVFYYGDLLSFIFLNYCLYQLSHSIVSFSWWPHGLQHARLPCASPTPGACSSSCPLSWWCHPTISSSVVPFSSCPQSFPASGSFPVSWLFTIGGPIIVTSASASVFPMNSQGWFPLELIDCQLLIAKLRLKSKKVWKTSRPFRYDLNQIPYDYAVEVTKLLRFHYLLD